MSEKETQYTISGEDMSSSTPTVQNQRPLSEKKRVKVTPPQEIRFDPDAVFKANPYYIAIAKKFSILKYIVIFLAFVFAITMLTAFSQDITAENFQYLIKDLDLSGLMSDGNFESMVFSANSDSSFGLYRGELVVVNAGSTELYRPSGVLALRQANIYYRPALLTSKQYFLVYDHGDTSRTYSVFNSFAELKTEKFDYPITGAALSDEGSYAIVTRDDSFRSVVYVYDRDFVRVLEVKKENYITSVDLTADGKTLAIASVFDRDGSFEAELMVVRIGATAADAVVKISSLMPLQVKWLTEDTLALMFTDRVTIYRTDGTELGEIPFVSSTSLVAAIGDRLICTVHNESVLGYDKTVNIYEDSGHLQYSGSFVGELLQILPSEEAVYLLFEDRAVRIRLSDGHVSEVLLEPNAVRLLTDKDNTIVCFAGSASAIRFDEP